MVLQERIYLICIHKVTQISTLEVTKYKAHTIMKLRLDYFLHSVL